MDGARRLDFYRQMVRIRTFEEAIRAAYHADKVPAWDIGAGLIPGEMHLSAGQEPVAVGLCAHLRTDDAITGPHRAHHLALAKGVDMKKMTAEIYGRVDGLGRGRGGHMHLFDPVQHFSCSGIIAEGMPVAVGQALAFSRKGTGGVAVAVAGEGAANQGAFHEALNLAALWKLPVVFVIEDNDWAISVPRSASTSVASNADRAAAYGMPGVRVEDNSVEGVYAAAGEAIERARSGGGPTLIEVHTLRLWGHFEGDAEGYRPELKNVPEHDPIPIYRDQLLATGALDDSQYQAMQKTAGELVADAIDFAKSSPTPDPLGHLSYVFSEGAHS